MQKNRRNETVEDLAICNIIVVTDSCIMRTVCMNELVRSLVKKKTHSTQ